MKTNFRNLTLILLVPALVLGIFTVYHSNPISKILFEIFFILIPTLYIFFNRVRLPSYIFYYILFLMFCFARFAISVIYNFEFFLDYLLIIRSQINIFLIIIIISMSHSSTKYYDYLLNFLVLCFIVAYISEVVFANNYRPRLVTENNFEAPFLVFYLIYSVETRLRLFLSSLAIISVLISRSLSTFLGLCAALGLKYIRNVLTLKVLPIAAILLVITAALPLFLYRLEKEFMSIDRVVLFMEFLEVHFSRSLLEIVLPIGIFEPLPLQTCSKFTYYPGLFADFENRICFSVLLHGYVPRIIYDFGILGFCYVFYTVFKVIRWAGFSFIGALSLEAVIFVNGLSVSGLNNVILCTFLSLILSARKSYLLSKAP